MIRALFARISGKQPPPATDNRPVEKRFPEKDRQTLFERRALQVMNRDREKASIMVRKLTILAEGRK